MNSEERTGQYVRIVYKTPGIMRQINPEKLAKLSTANSMLDEKYGAHGTPSREQFNEESLAWFYGNMLRERRKELNLTQKQLAENSDASRATSPASRTAKPTFNCRASSASQPFSVSSSYQLL